MPKFVFEGKLLFSCYSVKVPFKDPKVADSYLVLWVEPNHAVSAPVTYESRHGKFRAEMNIPDGSPDILKMSFVIRTSDPESLNRRSVKLMEFCADLNELLGNGHQEVHHKDMKVSARDYFMPNNRVVMHINLVSSSTHVRLTRSALRDIPESNKYIQELKEDIMNSVKEHKLKLVSSVASFAEGITCWELDSCILEHNQKIPSFQTHFSLLNHMEEALGRSVPVGLLVYNFALAISHTGKTLQYINDCYTPTQKAELLSQCLSVTNDAGMTTYERDMTVGARPAGSDQIMIGMVTTENMGIPLSVTQFVGRDLNTRKIPKIDEGMSFEEMQDRIQSMKGGIMPSVLADDCESLSFLAKMLARTLMSSSMKSQDLKKNCKPEKLFEKISAKNWNRLSKFMEFCQNLMISGQFTVTTSIGLASSAAAGNGDDGLGQLMGHSFNVGVYESNDDVSKKQWKCFMMEATAKLRHMEPSLCEQKVPLHIVKNPGEPMVTEMMQFHEAVNGIGRTISILSRVADEGLGHRDVKTGWLKGVGSWCMNSTEMPSLDSKQKIKFYQRIVYTRLYESSKYVNCLPVSNAIPGCEPSELFNGKLKGFGISLDSEILQLMDKIFKEVAAPQVPDDAVEQVMSNWMPLPNLGKINKHIVNDDNYFFTPIMETPCIPESTPIVYVAKKRLFEAFNKINMGKADSDQIKIVETKMIGTGVQALVGIPRNGFKNPTAIQSLKEAAKSINWPFKMGE
jgi:hypothetical protein